MFPLEKITHLVFLVTLLICKFLSMPEGYECNSVMSSYSVRVSVSHLPMKWMLLCCQPVLGHVGCFHPVSYANLPDKYLPTVGLNYIPV